MRYVLLLSVCLCVRMYGSASVPGRAVHGVGISAPSPPVPAPFTSTPTAPIHFVIHPHPSVYQFLSIPPIPVDVVFSHCPVGHSLELY